MQQQQPPPPPTPFPVSARSRSSFKVYSKERKEKVFRELNGGTNAISRSEQNFSSIKKRSEEEMKSQCRSTNGLPLRRYSVASKYSSPKKEKSAVSAAVGTTVPGVKSISKRPSLKGAGCAPSQTALKSRNLSVGKLAVKVPTASFWGTITPKTTYRKQATPKELTSADPKQTGNSHTKSSVGGRKEAGAPVVPIQEPRQHFQTNEEGRMVSNSLKSASYWLQQIKLAECISKHGVSLGLFRLAVECDAQPLQLLQEALLSYTRKYTLCSEIVNQVLFCYGISKSDQEVNKFQKAEITCSDKNAESFNSMLTPSSQNDRLLQSQELSEVRAGESKSPTPENNSRKASKETGSLHPEKEREKTQNSGQFGGPSTVHSSLADEHIGCVESMDVESLMKEVVSCIMSSLDNFDCSSTGKSTDFLSQDINETTASNDAQDHVEIQTILPPPEHSFAVPNLAGKSILSTNSSEGITDHDDAVDTDEGHVARSSEQCTTMSCSEAINVEQVSACNGSEPSLDVWNNSSMEVKVLEVGEMLPQEEEVQSLQSQTPVAAIPDCSQYEQFLAPESIVCVGAGSSYTEYSSESETGQQHLKIENLQNVLDQDFCVVTRSPSQDSLVCNYSFSADLFDSEVSENYALTDRVERVPSAEINTKKGRDSSLSAAYLQQSTEEMHLKSNVSILDSPGSFNINIQDLDSNMLPGVRSGKRVKERRDKEGKLNGDSEICSDNIVSKGQESTMRSEDSGLHSKHSHKSKNVLQNKKHGSDVAKATKDGLSNVLKPLGQAAQTTHIVEPMGPITPKTPRLLSSSPRTPFSKKKTSRPLPQNRSCSDKSVTAEPNLSDCLPGTGRRTRSSKAKSSQLVAGIGADAASPAIKQTGLALLNQNSPRLESEGKVVAAGGSARRGRRVEDSCKQIVDGDLHAPAEATPGSISVRRSARLKSISSVSTPRTELIRALSKE